MKRSLKIALSLSFLILSSLVQIGLSTDMYLQEVQIVQLDNGTFNYNSTSRHQWITVRSKFYVYDEDYSENAYEKWSTYYWSSGSWVLNASNSQASWIELMYGGSIGQYSFDRAYLCQNTTKLVWYTYQSGGFGRAAYATFNFVFNWSLSGFTYVEVPVEIPGECPPCENTTCPECEECPECNATSGINNTVNQFWDEFWNDTLPQWLTDNLGWIGVGLSAIVTGVAGVSINKARKKKK